MSYIDSLDIKSKFVTYDLSSKLLKRFGRSIPTIICLGSDKVLSDMVGVFVADKLKKACVSAKVFGGTELPITKNNLDVLLEKIDNKNILFVDSSISDKQDAITFCKTGITLHGGDFYSGASINAGTISKNGQKLMFANTSYKKIMQFVEVISTSILDFVDYVKLLCANS